MLVQVLSFLIAFVAGALAVVAGMHIFTRLTGDFAVLKELKRGNLAVGLALTGVLLSTAILVQGGLWTFVNASVLGKSVVASLVQIFLGFVLSLVVANGGTRLFDWATPGIEVFDELRKGNSALGVALAAYLVAIAWVVSTGISLLAW